MRHTQIALPGHPAIMAEPGKRRFPALAIITLTAGLCLLAGPAAAAQALAAAPGGQGQLRSEPFMTNCFKPASGTVREVCASYTIRWKLWSLMGEPVGDYNVAWEMTSIDLMDPQRQRNSSYTPATLPAALKKGAKAIELYLDGYVGVESPAPIDYGHYRLHRFNTGTAVRSGAGSSLNMPGSPKWEQLFNNSRMTVCDDKVSPVDFLDAKQAKAVFTAGVKLADFRLCRQSGVSELSAIENAIHKLCAAKGADQSYSFCPEQPKEAKTPARAVSEGKKTTRPDGGGRAGVGASALDGDGGAEESVIGRLDEESERPATLLRLKRERDIYRDKVRPGCRKTMDQAAACYVGNGCRMPAEQPSAGQCREIPPLLYLKTAPEITLHVVRKRGDLCYNEEDADCRRHRLAERQERREQDQKDEAAQEERQRDWESRYGGLAAQCKTREAERSAFAVCQQLYAASCNPAGYDGVEACVTATTERYGPTEKDARKLVDKDRQQRSSEGGSLSGTILD